MHWPLLILESEVNNHINNDVNHNINFEVFYCNVLWFTCKYLLVHVASTSPYRAEMDVQESSLKFGLMLEAYLRGSVNHIPELRQQMDGIGKMRSISELLHSKGLKDRVRGGRIERERGREGGIEGGREIQIQHIKKLLSIVLPILFNIFSLVWALIHFLFS